MIRLKKVAGCKFRVTGLLCLVTCYLFLASFFLIAQAQTPPSEAKFFSAMQDVPLVDGLTELSDQTVTFDKPEGRIVESVAEIESGSEASVEKAYAETLPQLGWTRTAGNSYAREAESLSLNFESYDGRNFVRVLVRPKAHTLKPF